MPTISMFYGILDVHGRLIGGDFPPRQLRLVQAWIEIHRDELYADWELAVAGEEPFRIAPLQ